METLVPCFLPDITETLLSVAAEIETGVLVPGKVLFYTADYAPCCVIGHISHRTGLDPAELVHHYASLATAVLLNDAGNWPGVVGALRQAAEEGPDHE
jgi:predicted urease superfamily metal-dependent hydrolase